jgi:hypothetical protein
MWTPPARKLATWKAAWSITLRPCAQGWSTIYKTKGCSNLGLFVEPNCAKWTAGSERIGRVRSGRIWNGLQGSRSRKASCKSKNPSNARRISRHPRRSQAPAPRQNDPGVFPDGRTYCASWFQPGTGPDNPRPIVERASCLSDRGPIPGRYGTC